MGRPLKYGEPTVKREVRLPESLSEELSDRARKRGTDMSAIVVESLRDNFEAEDKGQRRPDMAVQLEEIKSLLAQRPADGLIVQLPDDEMQELKALALSFGYTEPHLFVKTLTRRALDHSHDEVHAWLVDADTRALLAEDGGEQAA